MFCVMVNDVFYFIAPIDPVNYIHENLISAAVKRSINWIGDQARSLKHCRLH